MTTTATQVDVRTIAPRDRHPLIFSTFQGLAPGAAMELVNDHDPRPLYYQFNAEMPGEFSWDYLEAGPETWRVSIKRVAPASDRASGSDCCGGGCGA